MKLAKDLREFIALLNALEVDYVIVGGHAVAYHGHPRYTGDIDFLYRPVPANAAKLRTVLDRFGFGDLDVSMQELLAEDFILQLGHPPNRVDLLNTISGVGIEQIWSHRVAAELDSLPVYFLGLDELLQNKAATGRAKDAGDVAELQLVLRQSKS